MRKLKFKKKKYMILCVAGQSNAVGYDESPVTAQYMAQFRTDRLFQLGLYGADNMRVIPLGACAQNFQDLRPFGNPASDPAQPGTKGIHLPLADRLLNFIPADYDLLVLPCAYGGCGFTNGQEPNTLSYDAVELRPVEGIWRWGVKSPYYLAMKARIGYLLQDNPENRFLGVVWCQGEHDAADAAGQIAGFDAMTEDFFRYFKRWFPNRVWHGNWDRNIWYNYETTFYWYTQGQCAQIWQHYREWNPDTYVEIPRETDTNAVNGTGKTAKVREAHFGNNAFVRVIAPRVAAAIGKRA